MSDDASVVTEALPLDDERKSPFAAVVLALLLPILAPMILWFVESLPIQLGISLGTIVISSALVVWDAARLGRVDRKGVAREHAGMMMVGLCGLWLLVFPVVLFRRKRFTGPNLLFPALFSVAAFVGLPFLKPWVIPAALPSCTSPEVASVIEEVIRSSQGSLLKRIDGHKEVRFDPQSMTREGACTVHTAGGSFPVKFIVEWQDKTHHMFQVRILPPDLPACDSPSVLQVLEQVVRSTPLGTQLLSMDGHRELSFNAATNVRKGVCIAHTRAGDMSIHYLVEWQDLEKGLFQVRTVPPE